MIGERIPRPHGPGWEPVGSGWWRPRPGDPVWTHQGGEPVWNFPGEEYVGPSSMHHAGGGIRPDHTRIHGGAIYKPPPIHLPQDKGRQGTLIHSDSTREQQGRMRQHQEQMRREQESQRLVQEHWKAHQEHMRLQQEVQRSKRQQRERAQQERMRQQQERQRMEADRNSKRLHILTGTTLPWFGQVSTPPETAHNPRVHLWNPDRTRPSPDKPTSKRKSGLFDNIRAYAVLQNFNREILDASLEAANIGIRYSDLEYTGHEGGIEYYRTKTRHGYGRGGMGSYYDEVAYDLRTLEVAIITKKEPEHEVDPIMLACIVIGPVAGKVLSAGIGRLVGVLGKASRVQAALADTVIMGIEEGPTLSGAVAQSAGRGILHGYRVFGILQQSYMAGGTAALAAGLNRLGPSSIKHLQDLLVRFQSLYEELLIANPDVATNPTFQTMVQILKIWKP